ncbi:RHS repeat domain-containing protein [Nonomuraea lactucae]|uniref:RHS repeat domain-containing protein n=1 Tax=Nonomuraea lactucae TaxID=2249762 RepID=UPI0013B430B4|nr:RHS repeat protein [Nonomuraea lactucae]
MSVRRWISAVLGPALVVTLMSAIPSQAQTAPKRLQAQLDRAVPGTQAKLINVVEPRTGKPFQGKPPVWPTGEVELEPGGSSGAIAIKSGNIGKVKINLLGHSAEAHGLLLKASSPEGLGKAKVSIDYSGFKDAYGADWASRLRLVNLTTSRPLATENDLDAQTVAADVELPATLAVQAAPSGSSGDYSATSLQPSATWTGGGSSGDFAWNYPLRMPPSVGGESPKLALAYSSQSVDGRMVSSNNQPSWAGEGFELATGFIERKYKGCAEDRAGGNNSTDTGDQCWATDNATLSLNGRGGDLVYQAGKGWRMRSDDGSKVERRTGGANGDDDGEHWVVTTPDGTQYWFGRNRLPGWVSGKAETGSVLTSPVYGNHSGEPCHATAFADSSCTQAYRWQLDYVVDPSGNTSSYWYAKEINKYGRNGSSTDLATYDRAGHLTRIDYGTRSDTAYGTVPAQVVFDAADRCLANCSTKNATTWPDTPFDQECTASPCYVSAPTFWTAKRLSKITTRVWDAASNQHKNVESWTFTHSFPSPGDGTRAGLWLDKISHSGHVGTTAGVPDVTFQGVQMANRVDATDHSPAMNWWRISHINTETGGKIAISYSPQDCVAGTRVPTAPEANLLRCYPVKWTPPGYKDPITDYFHKYVVTQVTESDLTGGAPRAITTYAYLGDPAWHYTDDDGLVKAENKTWSVWRGYGTVRTVKGDPGEQVTTETTYFRGMHGDKLPSGTRSITLPAAGGAPAVADEDTFAGLTRHTVTLNDTDEVRAESTEPWQSSPSATRTLNGVTVNARFTGTAAVHTRTALDGGRPPRITVTRNTMDDHGMVIQSEESGDTAKSGDERCTKTTYEPRNTTGGLLTYPHRVESYAVACNATPATEDDVIGDERTSYDGQPYGTAPGRGRATQVESLKTWTPTARTYVTTSRSEYDAYGRITATWDVKGNKSSTAYTPGSGTHATTVTMTNPLGWVTTNSVEPASGATTKIVDANGRVTELAHDGLARLTSVWLPGRDRTSSASMTFSYLIRNNAPTVVTNSRLNAAGQYVTYHTLYDGMLRVRQIQSPEAGTAGGRIVSDTFYDSTGRGWKTYDAYVADGAPSTTLFKPTGENVIPTQTRKLFDGAGRQTAEITLSMGVEKWRTTTAHSGDRVDVTPAAGGTATSTVTDVRGKTVAMRQHTGTGSYDTTAYAYTPTGELKSIVDPAGNRWEYDYDLRGRQTRILDPDKGETVNTYNDAGELTSVKGATGRTLTFTYDPIGRKTATYEGTTKRAEWIYDAVVKGQLAKSIRHDGGNAYSKEILGYSADYKPTQVTYSIPTAETGLAGTYTYNYGYTANSLQSSTRLPDVDGTGGLGGETLTTAYTSLDKPSTLSTSLGATTYVDTTSYTRFGELAVVGRRNAGGRILDTGLTYAEGTRRVTRMLTTRELSPATVSDVGFTYDDAGNITKLADGADAQCFAYDYLRRVTSAWTPQNGDCSSTVVAGPAPYQLDWTYDKVGNRTRQVAGDVTTTYTYSSAHRLSGWSASDGGRGDYTYDAEGNTLTRPGQTLTWDVEGELATVSGGTSLLYDADGNRLIRRDSTGKTLYLPDQELRYNSGTGARSSTRYYSHAGHPVAMRTEAGLTWLVGDHQGTALISVHPDTQQVARRRQTPYGTARAGSGTWPAAMDKGFVGGTSDPTGLVHLGARLYDPAIGRFLSVDPIIDPMDPQQLHAYGYANGSPVTMSDPDGQILGWLKKVASPVMPMVAAAKAVAQVTMGPAVQAATAAVNWVKNPDNWSTIATVAGVVAVCTPPPINLIAGGVALVATAADTYKNCKDGISMKCATSAVGLIPGGRVLGAAAKVAKARTALNRAEDAIGGLRKQVEVVNDGFAAAARNGRMSQDIQQLAFQHARRDLEYGYKAINDAKHFLHKAHKIEERWERIEQAYVGYKVFSKTYGWSSENRDNIRRGLGRWGGRLLE